MRYVQKNFSNQFDGDTFLEKEVNFFEADGTPLDMSDVTPRMQIRKGSENGKLVKTAVIGDGLRWENQGKGQLRFGNFPINWGGSENYHYDIQFTYATSGIVRTYVKGIIKVIDDVTNVTT